MAKLNMEVTKTENKKRVPVGSVEVYCPDLEELKEVVASAKQTETDDEGLPVYDTNEANWLMSAVRLMATSSARNKLQKGSVECRPGLTIPTTLKDLTAPSTGGGNAEYLKAVSLLNGLFKEYAESLGKTAKTTGLLVECFKSQKYLAIQGSDLREKLRPHFEGFASWLEATGQDELPEHAITHYSKIMAMLDVEEDEDDFDDL